MSTDNDNIYDSRSNTEPSQDEPSDPLDPVQYFLEDMTEPEDGIPTI